ncbi:MAG: exonuclease SbcCD subunit D [Hyphomicrobiaceae bacterium]
MSFTFVHTGDWHIGKPFGRFAAGDATVLRRARLEAIDRLAAVARGAGAGLVLVAGDVYDGPDFGEREMREPLARMKAYPDLAWHIIPGNHDPACAGGIWERALRDGVPPSVTVHLEPKPVQLADGCWLLPAPLAAKATERDPTEYMAAAPTPEGMLRIGLAHGSVRGFGSDQQASINIAPDRPLTAGLAYLALGDWHGVRRIGPSAWYAGTPEPDGFLDNEPGHALVVRIPGVGALPQVETCPVGQFRWLKREIDLTRPTDLDSLEQEIGRLGPAVRNVLIEITASGRVSLAEDGDLAQRLNRIEAAVFHLSRLLDGVRLAPAADDLEALGSGILRNLAGDLVRLASDKHLAEAAAAERALRRLYEFAEAAT